jgi:transcriptional regulator with XRE-family HTH domain
VDSREPSPHSAAPSQGLGQRLRDARTAKGWTQSDLAGADFSVGYVSRIESGARQPSRAAVVTLAARLGVSTEFLSTGAEQDQALSRRHDLDRAELALAGGDIAAARVSVSALIDSGALRPWPALHRRAQLVHALAREAEGDTHAAIIELEDLHATTDDDEAAATLSLPLSRCYRETGDFTQAIEVGQRGLASLQELGLAGTTDHIRLSVTLAAAYFEAGQVGVATRLARRAIAEAEAANSP